MIITEFTAEKTNNETILLMWTTDPLTKNLSFDVLRALNDGDDFILISRGEATTFLDANEDALLNEHVRYKIKCGEVYSKEVIPHNIDDPYTLGVAGDYLWQLRAIPLGIVSYVYCRANIESACPECYNATLKKRVKSSCDTCDGSGTIKGYKGPVKTYINYSQIIRGDIELGQIEKEEEIVTAQMSNLPIVNKGDIVIRSNAERYIVNRIPDYKYMTTTKNEKFIVMQKVILKKLLKPHEAYSLEVTDV